MKQFFRFVYFIIFLSVMNSCRTGKDYQRPTVLLPESFQQNAAEKDSNSIGDIAWRNYFSDSLLIQLIDSGLARNFDLQIAIRNISIAQSQVKQTQWLWVPQLTAGVSPLYYRNSDNGPSGINNGAIINHSYNLMASVNMNWEIDIWGKISRQQEAGRADFMQNYEAAKAVQTSLVASIAQGYFNLLEVTIEFVKLTRLLFNAGEVTYLGVQQAESQKNLTAELVPQIEQSILVQENSLQLLTGNVPGSIHRGGNLTDIHFKDSLQTGVPVAILHRRPDVRASEMALVTANAQVGISQANMYPALNLTAGAGFESLIASNWFNIPGSLFGLAGATLIQPILQKRQMKIQLEISK